MSFSVRLGVYVHFWVPLRPGLALFCPRRIKWKNDLSDSCQGERKRNPTNVFAKWQRSDLFFHQRVFDFRALVASQIKAATSVNGWLYLLLGSCTSVRACKQKGTLTWACCFGHGSFNRLWIRKQKYSVELCASLAAAACRESCCQNRCSLCLDYSWLVKWTQHFQNSYHE